MTISRSTLLGAVLCSLVMTGTIHAADTYYKWTDEGGVVHYGENPPDPGKAIRINVKVGSSRDEAVKALEESRAQEEVAREKAKDAAEEAGVKGENAKIVAENCKIYNQNMSAMKNSARIREKDAKGEYRYLTEEEKAERMKTAETYLKENCQ